MVLDDEGVELATIQSVQAARALADLARDALWGTPSTRSHIAWKYKFETTSARCCAPNSHSKWFKGSKQQAAKSRREKFFTSAHAHRET